MEKLLVLMAAAFLLLSFSMVAFASDQNIVGGSINWRQLDRIANTEYAGIGGATKMNLASSGERWSSLDELSGSENQTGSMIGAAGMKMDSLATCGPGEVYTGDVAWVDPDIHRIMVTGLDGNKIFDVSGATMKGVPEAHKFVVVKYTETNGEKIASSVSMVSTRVAFLYVGEY